MKKLMIVLTALFTMTVSANAMSYEQARDQALFLTDKMAYELNLTEDQYEAAFEINLDYLMSVETVDDLYGTFWTPTISTAHSTGTEDSGTLASTHAIRTAATSTSDARTST